MKELNRRKEHFYVEQNFDYLGHDGREAPPRTYESNQDEGRKRGRRRKRIEHEQIYGGSPIDMSTFVVFNQTMEELGVKRVDNFPKRRTRGKGRKINPKE